ncbi:HAD family hydrolase [Zhaonella formicivorans]|uniref:HAD family hydrolase n=1 Tax=Zhaonella formicivorans TaxID=2528593 RepID=UPI0010E69716|nr:HAD family hydrolase [Zhaonella formicivorans]
MLEAILFDLDGTLLPMDTDEFLNHYFKLLTEKMQQYLDSKLFMRELLAATDAMIKNTDSAKSNEQVFIEAFFPATGLVATEIMPVFEEFYTNDYCQLGCYFQPDPLVKEIVHAAQEKGLKLVLATNPLFPLIAIKERMRWAGVSEFDFALITSYEEMHACKPNLEYYREICAKIKVPARNCLMVGNDVEEDLIAQKIGMQTFLVEDYLLNRHDLPINADYRGSLKELYQFVVQL